MGVRSKIYSVYGVKLGFDDVDEEIRYGDKEPADNRLSVIVDGMCGEYIVIGLVLDQTKAYEGFNGFTNITPTSTQKTLTKRLVNNFLGEEFDKDPKFEVLVFTHYY